MSVKYSNYTCKAGFRHCNHTLGLLDLLCHNEKLDLKTVPYVMSITPIPQPWHIPQRVFETVEDTEVQMISKTKRKRKDEVKLKMCCLLQQPLPFSSIITNLTTL